MRAADALIDKSEAVLAAADPKTICVARELANHWRWVASKYAPGRYGDKLQHTGGDGGDISFKVVWNDADKPVKGKKA